MDLEDGEEWAFIAALKKGDVVRHPETGEWMRIASVDQGVTTRIDGITGATEDTAPWRLFTLFRLDRDPWETPIPQRLEYNDVEERIVRRKGTGE